MVPAFVGLALALDHSSRPSSADKGYRSRPVVRRVESMAIIPTSRAWRGHVLRMRELRVDGGAAVMDCSPVQADLQYSRRRPRQTETRPGRCFWRLAPV